MIWIRVAMAEYVLRSRFKPLVRETSLLTNTELVQAWMGLWISQDRYAFHSYIQERQIVFVLCLELCVFRFILFTGVVKINIQKWTKWPAADIADQVKDEHLDKQKLLLCNYIWFQQKDLTKYYYNVHW